MRIKRLAAATTIAVAAVTLSIENARPQDAAKIDAGESVYNMYCYTCHGEKLVNSGQTFDLRRLTADERARFDNSVRKGKNQMPPWDGVLTDQQIDQIWAFVRANANQK